MLMQLSNPNARIEAQCLAERRGPDERDEDGRCNGERVANHVEFGEGAEVRECVR
jgi:hypothetical protein